ncbi:MAG TPA: PfkB family carbohydrate kinase [Actinomycetota bacterium]|nr:PfkB family carbohydrate kinase [Actinomycetota bacterium]
MDLVTVGDLMVDVTVEASALRAGGDVHGTVRLRPGGSAVNAAVWAAASGATARLHGRIGDDLAGRLISEAIGQRGVEAVLAVDPGSVTGSMLVVQEGGERSMVADRGANARLSPADLPAQIEAEAVLVSGYVLLQEGSAAAGRAALDRARARYVAVDAASWPLVEGVGGERFLRLTEGANVLFANASEARALTGREGEDAADQLAQRYAVVCIKLGGEGAVLSWEGLLIRFGAEEIAEADPTGAGDAFDGAFLAALVSGAAPGDALRLACHAGARAAGSLELWPERESSR